METSLWMQLTENPQKIAIHEIVRVFVLQDRKRLDFRLPLIPAGNKRPAEHRRVSTIAFPRDCFSHRSHRFPAEKLKCGNRLSEIVAILHSDVDELFRGNQPMTRHENCRQMKHGPAGMPIGENRGILRDGGDFALCEKSAGKPTFAREAVRTSGHLLRCASCRTDLTNPAGIPVSAAMKSVAVRAKSGASGSVGFATGALASMSSISSSEVPCPAGVLVGTPRDCVASRNCAATPPNEASALFTSNTRNPAVIAAPAAKELFPSPPTSRKAREFEDDETHQSSSESSSSRGDSHCANQDVRRETAGDVSSSRHHTSSPAVDSQRHHISPRESGSWARRRAAKRRTREMSSCD